MSIIILTKKIFFFDQKNPNFLDSVHFFQFFLYFFKAFTLFMIYNTHSKLSYKKNINQTQIIINKILKNRKKWSLSRKFGILLSKTFFCKNYYQCKLDDYDSFFYINSCPRSYLRSLCFFIKIFQ